MGDGFKENVQGVNNLKLLENVIVMSPILLWLLYYLILLSFFSLLKLYTLFDISAMFMISLTWTHCKHTYYKILHNSMTVTVLFFVSFVFHRNRYISLFVNDFKISLIFYFVYSSLCAHFLFTLCYALYLQYTLIKHCKYKIILTNVQKLS